MCGTCTQLGLDVWLPADDAILKGRFRNTLAPDSGPNLLFILLTAQEIAGGWAALGQCRLGLGHSEQPVLIDIALGDARNLSNPFAHNKRILQVA